MRSSSDWLTLALFLTARVAGQIAHYEFAPPLSCNLTFADVNGTGVYYINPDIVQNAQSDQPDNFSGMTLDSAWAFTIQNAYGTTHADSELSASLGAWYSTNGADYSDDLNLGYDVCALILTGLNYNTILRGQSDNGTCLSALDQGCVSALQTATQQYAHWLTGGNSGTQVNITDTSLPGICIDIATMLQSNFPEECIPFVDGPNVLGGALTTYNNNYGTYLNNSCTMNGTFSNVLNFSANSSIAVYTNASRLIAPVMTVFTPVANQAVTISISNPVTELSCVHINHINPGSLVPETAPAPTPIGDSSNDGLSGGAIAGIVVGAVVAVLLLCGLGFWFWRKRRVSRHAGPSELPGNGPDGKGLLVEAPQAAERFEFPADAPERYELHTKQKSMELGPGKMRHELPG